MNQQLSAQPLASLIESWLERFGAPDASAADLLCDRWDADDVAFTLVDADLQARPLTFGALSDASRRLASGLAQRGVGAGDCVGVMMSKREEYLVSVMALWRLGAVLVPMFTAFSTGAVRLRTDGSGARLVITERAHAAAVEPIEGVDAIVIEDDFPQLLGYDALEDSVAIGGDGLLAMLFTSGTTGKPKGVPIQLKALAAFSAYMELGLDVIESDVYWNAADPGWAYGLYYGVLGPMAIGRPNILANIPFSPEGVEQVMDAHGVTNFAGAPTMYRAMAKSPTFGSHNLRRASSAGEPLTADILAWCEKGLGVEVRDHYGQTEHGMVVVNGWHDLICDEVKSGSMGRVMPGFVAAERDEKLVLSVSQSPLMFFRGYHGDSAGSADRFTPDGEWYFTGDSVRVDDDGYYFFAARDDDVILAAGYRIGPFDIESVLSEHPAVADVGVVGKPDEMRGEIVAAYVVTTPGHRASDQLAEELKELVRTQYSAHAYPRVVRFVDSLPKTPSGKIQRNLLRALED